MVTRVHRVTAAIAAFLVILGSIQATVLAAAADVGIKPAYPIEGNTRSQSIFIMELEPNETGDNGIRLINSGEEDHTVKIYPVDGVASADGSFSCRQASEDRKEVGSWVVLEQEELTLEPGAEAVVDFTVTVPDGASPGEHNGCIAVQDINNLPAKSGEGVLLGFRSAIRLSVRVPGEIVKQLDLLRVDMRRGEGSTYIISPVAKNTGNVSLDVQSYVQLVSVFGQKTKVEHNTSCPIVPGATLTSCSSTFDRQYWGGIYRAQTSLSYNANTADGIGDVASEQKRISMKSSYFVVWPDPLAALAELAVLGTVVWFIVAPLRRKARRRKLMRTWEKYVVQDSSETIMSIAAARGAKWRKIARVNRLKAPYALQVGKPIIVPKPKLTEPAKKQRKRRQSELDWFLDAEPLQKPVASEQPQAAADAPLIPKITPVAEQPKPEAPVALATPSAPRPVAQSSWANPVYSEPAEPVEYDENYVDWREGAAEGELQDIEQRLGDYTAVPRIKAQSPAPKKKSARTTTKKTPPKKQTKPKKRS